MTTHRAKINTQSAVDLTKSRLMTVPKLPVFQRVQTKADDPVTARLLCGNDMDIGTACSLCGTKPGFEMSVEILDAWMGAWTKAMDVKEVLAIVEEKMKDTGAGAYHA